MGEVGGDMDPGRACFRGGGLGPERGGEVGGEGQPGGKACWLSMVSELGYVRPDLASDTPIVSPAGTPVPGPKGPKLREGCGGTSLMGGSEACDGMDVCDPPGMLDEYSSLRVGRPILLISSFGRMGAPNSPTGGVIGDESMVWSDV